MICTSVSRSFTLLAMLAATLFLCSSLTPVLAEENSSSSVSQKTAKETSDTAPINQKIRTLEKTLATADSKTLASLWTETGQYIDKDGNKYEGRTAIENSFAHLFKNEGNRLVELAPETTRLMSSDTAYTEGKVLAGEKKVPETRYIIILLKRDGNWLIQSATEVPLVSKEKVASAGLEELSWLIGSWQIETARANIRMSAHWDADKRLIECRYEIKKSGQPTQIDIQVIGFDANSGRPVSWHFDSSGSYGFGNWFRKDNRWVIDANGIEADGSISSAMNLIENVQPDSFTWRSIDRHVSGVHLVDTMPLTVKRIQSTAELSNSSRE